MSDISIRFDGLFLLAALALGAATYAAVALVASALALTQPASAGRSWRVARLAGAMTVATLALFAVLFAWWAGQGTVRQGINWLDLMVFPWLAVFAAGGWALTRR